MFAGLISLWITSSISQSIRAVLILIPRFTVSSSVSVRFFMISFRQSSFSMRIKISQPMESVCSMTL